MFLNVRVDLVRMGIILLIINTKRTNHSRVNIRLKKNEIYSIETSFLKRRDIH